MISVEYLFCVAARARQCCKEVVRYGGESSFKGWRFLIFICSLEGVVEKMTRLAWFRVLDLSKTLPVVDSTALIQS